MFPGDVYEIAIWWGPGVLMLMVFAYGFLRLARLWLDRTMDARRLQAEKLFGLASEYAERFLSAQRSQADALSRLAASVERSDSRDSMEHQQILIALKVLHQDVERAVGSMMED
jgi:hypothetical protein